MTEIIKEARSALEKGLLRAALALTLILPDICAQIECPEIYKRGIGMAYKHWWNENIGKYEDGGHGMPYMDGEAAYQLRCAILHNGHSEISDKVSYSFNIISTGNPTFGGSSHILEEMGKVVHKSLQVSVENICTKIWSVSESVIDMNPEHLLTNSDIKINAVDKGI